MLTTTADLQLKVELHSYWPSVFIGWFVLVWGWKQCLDIHRTSAFWYKTVSPDFRCLSPDTIYRDSLIPQNWIHENIRRNALETPTWSGSSRKAPVEEVIVYGSLIGCICKLGALQPSQWRLGLQGMCRSTALKAEHFNTEKWVGEEAEVSSRLVPVA